ncbi:serine protease [Dyella sp. OK004]|uniref:RICIN domain-containing protein n=1 Tax=Dyella sp. OK004 TaxID=1855292 RepID=UPI0008E2D17A|nr:RICIN domain-containing protein [Dyella sp. OK004]SFS00060.1 serine protease [Dyella sp. OK004]
MSVRLIQAATFSALLTLAASAVATEGNSGNQAAQKNSHAYRHGVVVPANKDIINYRKSHDGLMVATPAAKAAAAANLMSYGGGDANGNGVTSGKPRVYLVVYGNQWGNLTTDAATGLVSLSKDNAGVVPYLQKFFKGLGTGGELWSGVMTQYCDGPNVTAGATVCPNNASFVGYPTGGAYAGIWYDNAAASPSSATSAQLAAEAVAAAKHFGNTTAASNRYVQYVILSPTGSTPDGFNTPNGTFCAYHSSTSDANAGSIAYTNMPYVNDIDAGGQYTCGEHGVNAGAAGTLDGFSITEGHEYAETITDQFFPNGNAAGWTDPNGQENGDLCALAAGGALQNMKSGQGSFAVQGTWSNDTAKCEFVHAIVGAAVGGTPTANFSATTNGLTATFTDSSTDAGGTITSHAWTFGDNGTSTATSPSHTYAAAGTYSVTETVTDSASGKTSSKTVSVTVSKPATNIIAANSSLCLNVATNSSGAGVIQSPCAATGNELWTLVPVGSYYHLVAKGSGLCLNVPGSSTATGTQLIQYGCQGSSSTNDQWSLMAVGGRYHIVSRSNGLCVNISGNSSSSGAKVIQWTCQSSTSTNDQFTF